MRSRDKLTNDDLVQRMYQAKAFSDPIVADFLDISMNRLFKEWKSPNTTQDEREVIHLQCQGLEAFRKFVSDTIIAGKNAEHEIARKNKASK